MAPPVETRWRLTDRGIAIVLMLAAMITLAALAVVLPTALRVTSSNYYSPGGSPARLSQPHAP